MSPEQAKTIRDTLFYCRCWEDTADCWVTLALAEALDCDDCGGTGRIEYASLGQWGGIDECPKCGPVRDAVKKWRESEAKS